jgi:hypothetical protein
MEELTSGMIGRGFRQRHEKKDNDNSRKPLKSVRKN